MIVELNELKKVCKEIVRKIILDYQQSAQNEYLQIKNCVIKLNSHNYRLLTCTMTL